MEDILSEAITTPEFVTNGKIKNSDHVKIAQFIYSTYRAIKIVWRYIHYITDMQYILIMQAEYFSDQTLRT